MDRQKIMTIVGAVLTTIIFLLLLYFLVFYEKVPVSSLANKFCTCSSEASPAKLIYSKEDFEYSSDLNQCFSQEFKTYTNNLSTYEKEYYIQRIKQEVVKQCPNALNNVFK
ncbi:MAG: hypothetical protein GY810_23820 [Aureispira sp.]|nr:hypothetical protein [Aureispira sp.]